MILPLILIILFSLFVFYGVKEMILRGHDLYALSFFILYVYTIFTQITYVFFPEYPIAIGVYYGAPLFYHYWGFMFFSFVIAFIIYKKINHSKNESYNKRIKLKKQNHSQYLFLFITLVLYLILVFYFKNNRELFGYGREDAMGSKWFAIGFRIFTICTLISFILFRQKTNKLIMRRLAFIIFIISFLLNINVSIAVGARSDILYFFIAIAFYELSPIINVIRYQKKKLLLFILVGFFSINILIVLSSIRGKESNISLSTLLNNRDNTSASSDEVLASKILMQDYFAPSYLLFMSMHYHFIDPIETIKSNIANSLIKFEYPLLTHSVTKKAGFSYDRHAGWGYHLFVEGYNAMGWFGILYNALFWNLGMAFWIRLSKTDNKEFNRAVAAILVLFVIALIRGGQTSTFIKTYWMMLIPSMYLLLLAMNSRMVFLKKMKYE